MENKETSDHNESQNTEPKENVTPPKSATDIDSVKANEPKDSEPKDNTKTPPQRRQPVKVIRDARKSKPENQSQSQDTSNDSSETAGSPTEHSAQDAKQSEGDDNRQRPRRGRRGRKGNDAPNSPINSQRQIKVDPKDVSKKAWKIFLAEVAEDGLGLITDKDAKEMAKRSFRVAELFLEEDARRRPEEKSSRASTPSLKKEDSPQGSSEEASPQTEAKPIKKKTSKKTTKRVRTSEKSSSSKESLDQEKPSAPQDSAKTPKTTSMSTVKPTKEALPVTDTASKTQTSPAPDPANQDIPS